MRNRFRSTVFVASLVLTLAFVPVAKRVYNAAEHVATIFAAQLDAAR